MPKTPQFFYFDLGNVLFRFDNRRGMRQIAKLSGLPTGDVIAFFANHDYQRRMELGQMSAREVHAEFCRVFQVAPPLEEMVEAGCDIFEINAPILPLLTRLAMANRRLGILSNTSHAHWEFLTANRYSILPDLFDVTSLSFEIKALKPDRKIYDAAAKRARVAPEEIFFTDDRSENVDGARAAGWQAIQFQSVHALSEELRRRGVQFNC